MLQTKSQIVNSNRLYKRIGEAVIVLSAMAIVVLMPTGSAVAQKGGGGTTPPPNPEIVFSNAGIKVMNANGTNVRTVVSLARGDGASHPCWSPDGTALAFVGGFGGQSFGVFTVNLDGSNRRNIVSTMDAALPQWSTSPGPNGQKLIAYTDRGPTGSFPNQRDVFVVNPDGTGKLNVTNTLDAYESDCAWSRDGSRLFFIDHDGNLMAANLGLNASGNVVVVSRELVWDVWGTAMPHEIVQMESANTYDGLVFWSMTNSLARLYVLDLSVEPPTCRMVTTTSSGDERFPSFSPNDGKIVFHRGGTSGGLFTVNTDGTGETRILSGSTKGFAPHWKRPAPSGP